MKTTITRNGKVLEIGERVVAIYRDAEKAIKAARVLLKIEPPKEEKIDYEHELFEIDHALYFALGYLEKEIELTQYESVELSTLTKMITSLKNMTARINDRLGLTDIENTEEAKEESDSEIENTEEVKEESSDSEKAMTVAIEAAAAAITETPTPGQEFLAIAYEVLERLSKTETPINAWDVFKEISGGGVGVPPASFESISPIKRGGYLKRNNHSKIKERHTATSPRAP